jgi:hypothetical protein
LKNSIATPESTNDKAMLQLSADGATFFFASFMTCSS